MLSPTHRRPSSAKPFRKRLLSRSSNVAEEDAFRYDFPEGVHNDFSKELQYQGSSSNSNSSVADSTKDRVFFEKEKFLNKMKTTRSQLTSMQKMRSFNIDTQGKIVDCGFRSGGVCTRPLTPRTPKNRRATCPEIWLSSELEKREPVKFILRIYGMETSGKSTVIHQMRCHADVAGCSDEQVIEGDGVQNENYTINFMMNNQEIELELIHGSALEKEPFQDIPTIYMILYTVDNRESFTRAAQILYRIYNRKVKNMPILVVGNKIDLQRKRKVTTIEGKMLAKIYKCGFVEISALLGMNMDEVWKEVVKKIQNKIQEKEKQTEKLHKKQEGRGKLTRIFERGRQIAKSCEELVARIIEL
ncbi:hypothetical protein FO519_002318 [Halicephalobus sp. NKZ332]|nr:hypothetical protein FO519_002318 [Halicephalobus sp. NKZ332]